MGTRAVKRDTWKDGLAQMAREHRCLPPGQVAALAVLLGGLLRLYHYNALSLWIDEGLTVQFSRLPWATVLGLHGAYDVHPPLYFALTKLASLLLPETEAGRGISVVAGTLTIPVVYWLASRLLGPRAGAIAAIVLALAPVHIWYSQEGRPYALTALLVATSYLALVAYLQTAGRRWLLAYSASLVLAMYTEYSAVFALIPQIAVLVVAVKNNIRRGVMLAGAGAAAAVLFLPWVPQLMKVAGPTSQQTQFALSTGKVTGSVLALVGLAGNGLYYWGGPLNPWDRWIVARPLLALVLLIAGGIGGYVLTRRSHLGLPVAGGLLAGTVVTATVISLIYPSFAVRTVLYGTLGWSVLLAACIDAPERLRVLRIAGLTSGLVMLALSLVTASSLYRGADKQHWRALAADTASASRTGFPVVTYPAVAGTLIGLYAPHVLQGKYLAVPDGGNLPARSYQRSPSVWLAYVQSPGINMLTSQLRALGYRRVLHQYYWNPLYLDLYLRPGQSPGVPMPINGTFTTSGTSVIGWHMAGLGATLLQGQGAGNILQLGNNLTGQSESQASVPAMTGATYVLRLQTRSRLRSGRVAIYLICMAQSGQMLSVSPSGAGASPPNDDTWHTVEIGTLCPTGTRSLLVDLRSVGRGVSDFRQVELRDLTDRATG